jgi:hypothetical protein
VHFADNHHEWFSLSTGKFSGIGGGPPRDVVIVHRTDPLRQVALRIDSCRRYEVRHVPQPDGRIGADIELDCDTEDGARVTASLHALSCR